MRQLKTAVVGVGALGRHHLKWYSQLNQSRLVGLYDIDRDKAKRYSEEYNITSYDSLDELADKAEAVSVVVPTMSHFDVASALIRKNVHCLIEKPVAATIDEANEIQALAKAHKVRVTVGHIERFNPAVLALDDINVLPSFIEAHRLAAFDPRGTDVPVVLDLMIHDVDLVLKFIKAELVDIQASAVAVVSEQADIANARLTFANGAVANLTASRISLQPLRKLRIFQKSGYYSLDFSQKQADLYSLAEGNTDSEGSRFPLGKSGKDILYIKKADSGQDMLAEELKSFLAGIINDSPHVISLGEATEALKVALEIERIGFESIQGMLESVDN